jgi:hypothetical protein
MTTPPSTPVTEKLDRFVAKGLQLIADNGWTPKTATEIRDILMAKMTVIKEPDFRSSQHWSCRVDGVKNNITGIEKTMAILLGGEDGY